MTLDTVTVELPAGDNQPVVAAFRAVVDAPRYVFYCLLANDQVAVHTSEQRLTGVLTAVHHHTQAPPGNVGVETFEFWSPQRRPGGHNLALQIEPALDVFAAANVTNGVARPTAQPNAWVADFADPAPALTLTWDKSRAIGRVELGFDTDWDHPMESALLGHPERALPFCVKHYRLRDAQGRLVAECSDNHQTRNTLRLATPVTTDRLVIECVASHGPAPAAVFEVRCYER